MTPPKVSVKTYVFTWAGLLALTLLTSLLGLQNLGPMSLIVGVVIAAMKAALIITFFMHAFFESKLVRVVLAGGIMWLLILLTLTLEDYFTQRPAPISGKVNDVCTCLGSDCGRNAYPRFLLIKRRAQATSPSPDGPNALKVA